jgi:hypothetical protein
VTTHGSALSLRVQIARLAKHHGIPGPVPVHEPLHPPTGGPMIFIGVAAATTVDRERLVFRHYAFTWSHDLLPPLLFKHRERAGTIDELRYDEFGRLRVTATVEHPTARRCSHFSVGCSPHEFAILDPDDPNKFRAQVNSAVLDEISITDVPSNPDSKALHRFPVSPATLSSTALIERLTRLQHKLKEIRV